MRLFALETDAGSAELVADRCWQAGAAGIWEVEPRPGVVTLRVGVDDPEVPRFLQAVDDLAPSDVTEAEAVVLATRTVSVGPVGAEVVLTVPPTVFGDGAHPTTARCLEHLVDLVGEGDRLLDVGCGSGALSVLGARLGAQVVAIDIDATAVETTRVNAGANQVEVEASTTPLSEVPGTYDVVAANISADTVLELAAELRRHTVPGGSLLLSGILADRWPEVRAAVGGEVRSTETVDGWLTAVVRC